MRRHAWAAALLLAACGPSESERLSNDAAARISAKNAEASAADAERRRVVANVGEGNQAADPER